MAKGVACPTALKNTCRIHHRNIVGTAMKPPNPPRPEGCALGGVGRGGVDATMMPARPFSLGGCPAFLAGNTAHARFWTCGQNSPAVLGLPTLPVGTLQPPRAIWAACWRVRSGVPPLYGGGGKWGGGSVDGFHPPLWATHALKRDRAHRRVQCTLLQ